MKCSFFITLLYLVLAIASPIWAEGNLPGYRIIDNTLDLNRKAMLSGEVIFFDKTVEVEHLVLHSVTGATFEVEMGDYSKRDGTQGPTADWAFGGYDLTGVGLMSATSFDGDGTDIDNVDAVSLNGYTESDFVTTTEILDYYTKTEADNEFINPTELATELLNYLLLDGTSAMTGDLDMGSKSIVSGKDATFTGTIEAAVGHFTNTVEVGASSSFVWDEDGKLWFKDENITTNVTEIAEEFANRYTKAESDATVEAYAYSKTEIDTMLDTAKEAHRILYVRKDGNDSGSGSEIDPFLTISHAYDIAETMTPTTNDPVVIDILGKFTEQVTVDVNGINFIGYGQGVSQWHYAGNALIITDNGVDPEPWDMKIKGISFCSTDSGEYAVKVQGIAGTSLAGNELQFMDCRFDAPKGIHINLANYIDFQNTYGQGSALYEQVCGIWYEGSESAGNITNDWDDAGLKPSGGSHYGVNFVQHLPRGSLTLLNSGTLGENYRPRELDDSGTSTAKVWSSDKINTELSGKLSTSAVLNDLADVNVPTPSDGQVLAWDNVAGEWTSETISAGTNTSEIETIIDEYSYNSTEVYTQAEINARVLNDLADVNTLSPNDLDILQWKAVPGEWTSECILATSSYVTVGTSGADYDNFDDAIDYLRDTKNGGNILVITDMTITSTAVKDISNITFTGNSFYSNSRKINKTVNGGYWHGDNVRFENLWFYRISDAGANEIFKFTENYQDVILKWVTCLGFSGMPVVFNCNSGVLTEMHVNAEMGSALSLPATSWEAFSDYADLVLHLYNGSYAYLTGTLDAAYTDASSSMMGNPSYSTPGMPELIDNISGVDNDSSVTGATGKDVVEWLDANKADTLEVATKADASAVYTKSETDATIEASISAIDLTDLANVNVSSPADGQSLVWNDAQSEWTSETVTGAGDMLKSVYDTNDNGISDSAEVVFDGVNNSTAAEIRTHLDTDVIQTVGNVETVIDDYSYNSTEIYTKTEIDTAFSNLVLDDISNVNVPSPSDGQVLSWNEAEGEWTSETIAAGVFEKESGVIRESDTNYDGDFVIGSGQLNDDGSHDSRFFFDKSTGSFRAGHTDSTQWDSRGAASFAGGVNTIASGVYSTAFGSSTIASGNTSTAFGIGSQASNNYSIAFGTNTIAEGESSTSFGNETVAKSLNSIAFGTNIRVGTNESNAEYSVGIGLDTTTRTLTQANTLTIMGGKVGIADLTPSYELSVGGTIEANYFIGDGSELTNLPAPSIDLDELNDVNVSGLASDEILIRNNSSEWVNVKIPDIQQGWTKETGVNGVTDYPCDADDTDRKMKGIPAVWVDDVLQYYPTDYTISTDKHYVVISGLSGGEVIVISYIYDANQ